MDGGDELYEEDELDGEEELSKILKAMKNENLELERRLMVSERECKHLQARAEGLLHRESSIRMVPNEPASGVVSADEVIGSELLAGFGTLSHIREIAADQFMGPMPAEVERLKVLNSCLPDLKFPWDAVEVADWSVDPPQEIKAFKPGAAFFEKDDEYYLISRGFFYDKKLENYVMYFIEGDTLQECLDQYDNVHTTSSPLCQYTWCFDIPGKCKGFLTWNLESIGCRGVDI